MARLYLSPRLRGLISRSRLVDESLRAVESGLVAAVMRGTAALPLERASDMGERIGRLVGPRMRKHRHVLRNMAFLFPQAEPAWIEQTALEIWGQIGRTLAEYPHLPEICGVTGAPRVEVASEFDLGPVRRGEQPMVFVAMHQANWNVPSATGHLAGFPVSVVFARQRNHRLERRIARWRDTMPCGFIDVAQAARGMLGELRRGRSVGVLVDHRVDEGEEVPFCGVPAPTTTVPARLAARLGLGVVPARVERLPGVRFRVTLEAPIFAPPSARNDSHGAAFEIMAEVNRSFERWVRERPADWCCVKRRWPKGAVPMAGEDHPQPTPLAA
ncbi:hypothetical protein SH611_13415 [Geminicoccaceae bacterium 1502E]|nr:hypothetical protein [Geminicoccaceae bacterium 1502E]